MKWCWKLYQNCQRKDFLLLHGIFFCIVYGLSIYASGYVLFIWAEWIVVLHCRRLIFCYVSMTSYEVRSSQCVLVVMFLWELTEVSEVLIITKFLIILALRARGIFCLWFLWEEGVLPLFGAFLLSCIALRVQNTRWMFPTVTCKIVKL